MKTFGTGAAFVLVCAMFAGVFTGLIFAVGGDPLGCDDAKAALVEYRIQHILTTSELERMEKMISVNF